MNPGSLPPPPALEPRTRAPDLYTLRKYGARRRLLVRVLAGPPRANTSRTRRQSVTGTSQSEIGDPAWLIYPIPEKPTGARASPPYHSRITHSRHRTALGGHQRTPAWSISYSRGRRGSLSDTGGHDTDTVRDREAPGSSSSSPWLYIHSEALQGVTVCLGPR